MNCGMHRGVRLLEHAMKIVEKVHQITFRKVVTINDMQFHLMPGKGTINAVITSWRKQEEYLARQKKLYMCFVDQEKQLTNLQRKSWNGQ